MRSTKDLIAELRAETTRAELVLLVVGFPTESKMVSASQPDVWGHAAQWKFAGATCRHSAGATPGGAEWQAMEGEKNA